MIGLCKRAWLVVVKEIGWFLRKRVIGPWEGAWLVFVKENDWSLLKRMIGPCEREGLVLVKEKDWSLWKRMIGSCEREWLVLVKNDWFLWKRMIGSCEREWLVLVKEVLIGHHLKGEILFTYEAHFTGNGQNVLKNKQRKSGFYVCCSLTGTLFGVHELLRHFSLQTEHKFVSNRAVS